MFWRTEQKKRQKKRAGVRMPGLSILKDRIWLNRSELKRDGVWAVQFHQEGEPIHVVPPCHTVLLCLKVMIPLPIPDR